MGWSGSEVSKGRRESEPRSLAAATLERRERELERFGLWLKRRRSKPHLEQIDSELVVAYVRSRT